MTTLDDALGRLAEGHGPLLVLTVSFVLGLRHATDPDHLVAVSTLVAGRRERAGRAAALLGAAWGAGHAATLLAVGVPVVALRTAIPTPIQALAETLIGLLIGALAVWLLVRWRRGTYHLHSHEHGGERHLHVHSHAAAARHDHVHDIRLPGRAFAVGLAHGLAGSGGVAILVVAAAPTRGVAVLALATLAAGAALSMALVSACVGRVLGAVQAHRAFAHAVPALGVGALAFGALYVYGALGSL